MVRHDEQRPRNRRQPDGRRPSSAAERALARAGRGTSTGTKSSRSSRDGEEAVFDLTVDGLHNFVAEDVVVHNSIEQDADLVMFVYRDEYYNPEETDSAGVAELILSKHRNGADRRSRSSLSRSATPSSPTWRLDHDSWARRDSA